MNGGPNLPLVVDRNRLLQRAFSRAVFNQPSLSGVIRYFTNYQSWGFENFSSRTLLIEQHGRSRCGMSILTTFLETSPVASRRP
jgi:hypothetical protein